MQAKQSKMRCLALVSLCVFWVSSGATCIRRNTVAEFQPPLIFDTSPTIQQLSDAINRSQNIRQLQSNSVSVRIEGAGSLESGSIVWERPKNFRLRGGISSLTGTNVDLGSNDDVFWMALRFGLTPELFYANHAQFDQQVNKQFLPVSPLWLVEAIGIVELDPYSLRGPPQPRADGLVDLTSIVSTPSGQFVRTLVVDPKYATIKQVLLKDPSMRLIAQSTMSDHQHYESVQYSLPHRVQIQLMMTGSPPLDMVIQIGGYTVNAIEGNDPGRFVMPDIRGHNAVNLVPERESNYSPTQSQVAPFPASPPAYPPANYPAGTYPAVSYRGLEGQGNTAVRR